MKVLVIGSGGREHCLVWKISQSKQVEKIYSLPGNGGIADIATCEKIPVNNLSGIIDFVKNNCIDITVVGPEEPLANGIVDLFEENNLKIFGVKSTAAQLESSKIFAKQFMKKYNIPTAVFEVFDSADDANRYLDKLSQRQIVIKADGLCAGKGAIVCDNLSEAKEAIENLMIKKVFGKAGEKVVIEERLFGEEVSLLAFCDGETLLPMPVAQDHKRVYDNDIGPNTGGMGAYAPVPFLKVNTIKLIDEKILRNFIKGIQSENMDFRGVIYFGLILTNKGPYVLEFNVRFGDPETQAILPLIDTDLFDLIIATTEQRLKYCSYPEINKSAICVVIASGGYPGEYQKGKEIFGLDELKTFDNIYVFHAGTEKKDGKYYTSGGRVLGITAWAKDLSTAKEIAYTAVKRIHFDKCHFRNDIGAKALKTLKW